jgi:hypothetical protein
VCTFIVAKILFRAKQIQNRNGFRTCTRLAALCAVSPKINGRRFAPPKNSSTKNWKVKFWCIFLSPLELTLAEIHENEKEKWRASRACGYYKSKSIIS